MVASERNCLVVILPCKNVFKEVKRDSLIAVVMPRVNVVFLCFLAPLPPQWILDSSFTRFVFFQITHNDAPKSVGLLWTSDQLVAETSTLQHTTLTLGNV
jgi:hypothetical protein